MSELHIGNLTDRFYTTSVVKGIPMDSVLTQLGKLRPGNGQLDFIEVLRLTIFTSITAAIGAWMGEGARQLINAESSRARIAFPVLGAIAAGTPTAIQLLKWSFED